MDENETPENTEPVGSIHFDWNESGNVQINILGNIGPIHLFGAAELCRIQGEMMYHDAQMEGMHAQANKLMLARSIPQDHLPKRN